MRVMSIMDKETGKWSKSVDLDDIILRQDSVEFEFGDYSDSDYSQLPYKDFLFFQSDYKYKISDIESNCEVSDERERVI